MESYEMLFRMYEIHILFIIINPTLGSFAIQFVVNLILILTKL